MTVAPGSINLISYSADAADGLTFIVLKPVLARSVITIPDGDWDGTSFGSGGASWTWTADADVPAGTKVTIRRCECDR